MITVTKLDLLKVLENHNLLHKVRRGVNDENLDFFPHDENTYCWKFKQAVLRIMSGFTFEAKYFRKETKMVWIKLVAQAMDKDREIKWGTFIKNKKKFKAVFVSGLAVF